MRRYMLLAVLAAILALVPVAGAGGGQAIISYTNGKGNTITHETWGTTFWVNGMDLNHVLVLECYAGKVMGHNYWATMDSTAVSSKMWTTSAAPQCSGYSAPIRGALAKGGPYIWGPNFTVTGTTT